jgi:hypothetical protein
MAERHSWDVTATYEDTGMSRAKGREQRPSGGVLPPRGPLGATSYPTIRAACMGNSANELPS